MSERDSMLRLPVVDACWNRIGISGDRSCPELVRHIHCRNCPVFADAAHALFDRPAPSGYLDELTQFVAEPAVTGAVADRSAVLFGVSSEQFALPSTSVLEVTETAAARSVPHRTNAVFLGLVNIRGQLELCVSLQGLLGLPEGRRRLPGEPLRVLVAAHESERWVFAIDSVKGVRRYNDRDVRDAPPASRRRADDFVTSLIVEDGKHYGLLDLARVCTGLTEKLT
jgi:chemotaxis-related protein WspD